MVVLARRPGMTNWQARRMIHMDVMSVASAAMGMHQAQLATEVQVRLLRMAMDSGTQVMEQLLQEMSGTVPMNPNIGNNLDIYV